MAYSDHYVQTSGMAGRSSAAIEFGCIMTAAHYLVTFDQINLLNTASGEFLLRRARMIQKAVARNARAPDYEGLDLMLSHRLDSSGGVATNAYDRHLAEEQETLAFTAKQTQLWREEVESDKKRKHAKGGGKEAAAGP